MLVNFFFVDILQIFKTMPYQVCMRQLYIVQLPINSEVFYTLGLLSSNNKTYFIFLLQVAIFVFCVHLECRLVIYIYDDSMLSCVPENQANRLCCVCDCCVNISCKTLYLTTCTCKCRHWYVVNSARYNQLCSKNLFMNICKRIYSEAMLQQFLNSSYDKQVLDSNTINFLVVTKRYPVTFASDGSNPLLFWQCYTSTSITVPKMIYFPYFG